MDDEARQKLLVLVPGLIGCAAKDDPPEIGSASPYSGRLGASGLMIRRVVGAHVDTGAANPEILRHGACGRMSLR
jgi:hypothetical protein